MITPQPLPALAPLLPLLVAASALLLTQASAESSRAQSMISALAICLISALGMLLLIDRFSLTNFAIMAMAQLAATAVASPLLDRTRFNGIALAASIAGIVIVGLTLDIFYTCLPQIAKVGILHSTLVTALVLGLAGSMVLPLHPARYTEASAVRFQNGPHGLLFLGWMLLALALAGLVWFLRPAAFAFPAPIFVTAMVAALLVLMSMRKARIADCVRKAGEALVAGILIAALAPLNMVGAAILGVVAGICVERSEAIAQGLRMDDPTHLVGALLLPAAFGLLLPGLMSVHLLTSYVIWFGASVAFGLALAAILWPLTMLFFGFALPNRRIREGRQ